MPRLITFGCSYTYGHGLPDCADGNDAGPNPSNFAWPSILADKMNLSLVNVSKPGSGNTEILWRILNFEFKHDDICIIMWSYFVRAEYYRYLYDSLDGVRLTENVATLFDEEPMFTQNNTIKNLLAMSHAAYHLELNKIKSYAYVAPIRANKSVVFPWEEEFTIPECIKINNLDTSFVMFQHCIDKALDKMHPGILSHQRIAEELYKKINELTNVIY